MLFWGKEEHKGKSVYTENDHRHTSMVNGGESPPNPIQLAKNKIQNNLFFTTTLKYINVHMGTPQTPNQLMKKNETEKNRNV